MGKSCLIAFLLFFAWSEGNAQDFEYQIDSSGRAFYCDSSAVLNSNPETVYDKFSTWFRNQYKSNYDTLIFTQEDAAEIYLKEIVTLPSPSGTGTQNYYLTLTIRVAFMFDKISYCVDRIYFLSSPQGNPCLNLAMDDPKCVFEGKKEDWNKLRFRAEREILKLVEKIQEFITS